MKLKYLSIVTMMSALSLASCNDSDNDGVKDPAEEGTPLKVMSFNIRYYNTTVDLGDASWEVRGQSCIDMLIDEAPDLVGLQEPRPVQITDLDAAIGDKYEFWGAYCDGVADNRCGHTFIMFRKDRFTVLDKGYYWLSPTPDEISQPAWNATDVQYRTTAWVYLHDNLADKDLLFYDTHLPYQAVDVEARTECVKLNVERMKAKAGRHTPVFIVGDMNASWYATDTRRSSLEGYFEWMWSAREEANNLTPDVYSYNDFGGQKPANTWNIDHIFYRRVTPCDFYVVNSDKYGVKYVSDHYPIVLTAKY